MEMSQMYDEDLLENKFFQQFCDMCPSLFQSAVQQEWMICVPKVGTFESHDLTEQDCLCHVLIKVSSTQYKTASDKHVSIKDKVITLENGFSEDQLKKITVLFSETFYSQHHKKYQVSCVDQPLSFSAQESVADASNQSQVGVEPHVNNVEDAIELLFTGENRSLRRKVDSKIANYKSFFRYSGGQSTALQSLVDTMHSLFTGVLQLCKKNARLRQRINLKLAVETYVNHAMYSTIFKYLCTVTGHSDGKLNKICRNLSQMQLKNLGIATEFSANIPRARRELLNLVHLTTPITKISCIKRVIVALMQKPQTAAQGSDSDPITVDELLPLLVFLIIRSSIPNWMANFEYMTKFHFSTAATEEYSFYLSTLEAALTYLKSNDKKKIQVDVSPSKSPVSRVSPIQTLFEDIRCGDLEAVRRQLESPSDSQTSSAASSDFSMCHPLCSCDRCEKLKEDSSNKEARVTVFSRDDKGYTALHQAALYNRWDIVEYLNSCGCVISATDYHGSTPLHLCCQKGHQSSVMMLIDCGADVNASDNDGNCPLHVAALNGHEECIKALLFQETKFKLDVNAANENGDTALHLAAKWSYESITELLLDHGASPEARNKHKCTPMMLVSDGRIANMITDAIERAQEIANHGFIELSQPASPEPTIPDGPQLLPEFVAAQPQRKVSKRVKKLLSAVADSDIEMVKHLMGWSAPTCYSSSDDELTADNTELCHPLCQCHKCAPTQKMQASLVDMNSCDGQGRTALHIAVERSNMGLVSLLLQKRANVNCKTDFVLFTPLHLACQQLQPNQTMIELLLSHGAKVNCKDCNGRTPLHFSSQTGSVETTRKLIGAGANVHLVNSRGNTPLHEAAKVNNYFIVDVLLQNGANPHTHNKDGLLAIQLTSDNSVRDMLAKAGECPPEDGTVSKARSLTSTSTHSLSSTQAESKVIVSDKNIFSNREFFTALERNQNTQDLLQSINQFNRQSLKKCVTRDMSVPVLDLSGINDLQSDCTSRNSPSNSLSPKLNLSLLQSSPTCAPTGPSLPSTSISKLDNLPTTTTQVLVPTTLVSVSTTPPPVSVSTTPVSVTTPPVSVLGHPNSRVHGIIACNELLLARSSDSNSYVHIERPECDIHLDINVVPHSGSELEEDSCTESNEGSSPPSHS